MIGLAMSGVSCRPGGANERLSDMGEIPVTYEVASYWTLPCVLSQARFGGRSPAGRRSGARLPAPGDLSRPAPSACRQGPETPPIPVINTDRHQVENCAARTSEMLAATVAHGTCARRGRSSFGWDGPSLSRGGGHPRRSPDLAVLTSSTTARVKHLQFPRQPRPPLKLPAAGSAFSASSAVPTNRR